MKKRSRRKRLPLPRRPLEWGLAIVAIALVAIAITSLGSSSSSSSAATKRTTTVGKGVVQSTVSGNGTLEPAQKVELSFGASGEVTKIFVKSGQKVTKGEVLAEVDSSSARASLASAKASLLEAEEAVETSEEAEVEAEEEEAEETAYDGGATTEFIGLMSENGTAATKSEGESTSTSSATEGTTGTAATEEEGAAEKEEASKSGKGTEGSTSGKANEGATKTAKPAAEEKAAPAEEATTEKATPEVTKSVSSGGESTSGEATGGATSSGGATGGASISLPTAEANLREAQLSVKSASQEVRETTLRAPISGTIASISGAVGETVTGGSSSGGGTSEASSFGAAGGESSSSGSGSGSAFMVLAQLSRLKMEVSFSESDIGKVRKGQTATVSVDSLEGTELSGEITKVSVLPSEEGSSVVEYPATIVLTQSAKGLRAGMSASAEVVVEQVKNAITVSSEALSGKSVTVEEEGKEVTKTVTTGLEGDETTQIISGLKVGDTVVLPEAKVATATAGGEGESGATKAGGFGGFGGAAAGGHFGGGFAGGGFGGGAP
ncbi:MAG TPA: HlyD family efflux transporter periplasmic adaptor subunit [Solirubrobacterales bacterium]|nr:HlyD family efflux transporter periplasmic adaptor subunit [Solirubrobacterales bacterium]